jgi:hypothetical protein
MRTLFTAALVALTIGTVGTGFGSAGERSGSAKLLGTYVRTVTKADIARTTRFRHEGPGQSPPPPGVVHLTFTAHSFRFVDSTGFAIAQTYSAATGSALTVKAYVNPTKGSFCGPEIPQNASYSWSINGRMLTLKAKDDRCADRDSLLTGRWTRVGT